VAWAQKRGKYWRAFWLTDEILPSGRRKIDSRPDFETKRKAVIYGEEQEAKVRAGTYISPRDGKITLQEWWEEWFPAQDWRPNTHEAYAQQWRRHIGPRWGHTALADIKPIKVQRWLKELREQYAASTVTIIISAMTGALEDAVYNKLIDSSPMPPKGRRGRKAPASVKPKRPGVVIRPYELAEILLRLDDPADRLLVVTTAFTGMRWSEVAAMRRQYLELSAPRDDLPAAGTYTIDPHDGAVHEDARNQRYTGAPKSGGGRILDLPPFLVLLLLAYVESLPKAQEILFTNRDGWFHGSDTWRITRWRPAVDGRPAYVSRGGRVVREAVPPIHRGLQFHDLKHTHAAMMDDAHTHPAMRNYRLGHATPGAPGVYSHPTPQMRRELVTALEAQWQEWNIDLSGPAPTTKSLPPGPVSPYSDNVLF
jgi:integrase